MIVPLFQGVVLGLQLPRRLALLPNLRAGHTIDAGVRKAVGGRRIQTTNRIRCRGDRLAWQQRSEARSTRIAHADFEKLALVAGKDARPEIELHAEVAIGHCHARQRLRGALLAPAAERVEQLELQIIRTARRAAAFDQSALVSKSGVPGVGVASHQQTDHEQLPNERKNGQGGR